MVVHIESERRVRLCFLPFPFSSVFALSFVINKASLNNFLCFRALKSRITAAEMKYMRKTAKYTWQDQKRNQEIMNELKTNPVLEKINNYKEKLIQHVHRMERSRLPRALPTTREKKLGTSTENEVGTGHEA
jgi:hypothetical protein